MTFIFFFFLSRVENIYIAFISRPSVKTSKQNPIISEATSRLPFEFESDLIALEDTSRLLFEFESGVGGVGTAGMSIIPPN